MLKIDWAVFGILYPRVLPVVLHATNIPLGVRIRNPHVSRDTFSHHDSLLFIPVIFYNILVLSVVKFILQGNNSSVVHRNPESIISKTIIRT